MAQTKKVSSTPTKTNSSSTATKKQPTAAEMREWYEKNAKNFKKGEEALRNLRDVSKTKNYSSISNFNKDSLREYLKNISNNEKNLRNLSRYLY